MRKRVNALVDPQATLDTIWLHYKRSLFGMQEGIGLRASPGSDALGPGASCGLHSEGTLGDWTPMREP